MWNDVRRDDEEEMGMCGMREVIEDSC